ncbi:MAG TPA: TonB family protein [Chitinophagaceae bacterium]|nr:TonB family protein [Chitinophagaceae bacterium]
MEANKILSADFLDILFEGKNKEYGAYQLRKEYDRRIRNATLIMVIAFILLAIGIILRTYLNRDELLHPKKPIADINLESVNLKNTPPPLPPPPPPPQPPKLMSAIKYTTPVVVKNEVKPEEQPPNMDQIKNLAISTKNIAGSANGIDPNLVDQGTGVVASEPANHVFRSVEQMPEFPGGDDALLRYLSDHIRYPAVARENGIQGTVFLEFVVNADGSIQNVKVISNPIGGGCEDEAMRVVKGMPRWRPGRQNGQAVRVFFHLPVRFRLE